MHLIVGAQFAVVLRESVLQPLARSEAGGARHGLCGVCSSTSSEWRWEHLRRRRGPRDFVLPQHHASSQLVSVCVYVFPYSCAS